LGEVQTERRIGKYGVRDVGLDDERRIAASRNLPIRWKRLVVENAIASAQDKFRIVSCVPGEAHTWRPVASFALEQRTSDDGSIEHHIRDIGALALRLRRRCNEFLTESKVQRQIAHDLVIVLDVGAE